MLEQNRAVFICSMFCMFANQLCMQYPELAERGEGVEEFACICLQNPENMQ